MPGWNGYSAKYCVTHNFYTFYATECITCSWEKKMINGLQVDVKSAELSKIVRERIAYHLEKSAAYDVQSQRLRTTMKDIEDDLGHGKTSNGDPAQNMDDKSREHKDKAVHFQFMLDHVIQDDIYRLDQNDLVLLGIKKQRW